MSRPGFFAAVILPVALFFPISLLSAEEIYSESFDADNLGTEWVLAGTQNWRIRTGSATTAYASSGAGCLLMDASTSGTYSANWATLALSVTDLTGIIINFDARDSGDESHAPSASPFGDTEAFDGVAISVDGGTNWYEIQGLRNLSSTHTPFSVDIGAFAMQNNLQSAGQLMIRFAQYDNYSLSSDGIAVDEVRVIRLESFPVYAEDFDDDALGSDWSLSGTANWRIRTGTSTTAYSDTGTGCLLMDASSNGTYSANWATLSLPLATLEALVLHFRARDFGDESHAPSASPFDSSEAFDGVAMSVDGGTNWYEIQNLRSLSSAYQSFTVDLEAFATANSLEIFGDVCFRIAQYDNYSISSDGIAVDGFWLEGTDSTVSHLPDADGDGLLDSEEDIDGDGVVDPGETDPNNPDSDGDGLPDGYEVTHAAMDALSANTIQEALDAALDNETVPLLPGSYNQSITFHGRGVVLEATLMSAEAELAQFTCLDGTELDKPVVTFASDSVGTAALSGIAVRNGSNGRNGGGILVESQGAVLLANCLIADNEVTGYGRYGYGGGIYVTEMAGGLTVRDCEIRQNKGERGGGIASAGGAVAVESSLLYLNNGLTEGGGGYFSNGSTVSVTGCTFKMNYSGNGGGIWIDGSSLSSVNTYFFGNSGANYGGAIYSTGSLLLVDFCTFKTNASGTAGGAIWYDDGGIAGSSVANTIIAENISSLFAGPESSACLSNGLAMSFAYCRLQELQPGTGNIVDDPLFNSPSGQTEWMYYFTPRLLTGSPCIDTADPSSTVTIDRDEAPRPTGTAPDMGAYEYRPVVTLALTDVSGSSTPAAKGYQLLAGQTVTIISPSSIVAAPEGNKRWHRPVDPAAQWTGTGSFLPSNPDVEYLDLPGDAVAVRTVIQENSSFEWLWPVEYLLSYDTVGPGTVTGELPGWYPANSAVTLTAVPDAGDGVTMGQFDSWWGNVVTGEEETAQWTWTLSCARHLIASFSEVEAPQVPPSALLGDGVLLNDGMIYEIPPIDGNGVERQYYSLVLLPNKWTFISPPLKVDADLFAETIALADPAVYSIWQWDGNRYRKAGKTPADLRPCEAYWIYCATSESDSHALDLTGTFPPQAVMDMAAGWNSFGVWTAEGNSILVTDWLSGNGLSATSVIWEFAFDGGSGSHYLRAATELTRGKAYWLRLDNAATGIILCPASDTTGDGLWDPPDSDSDELWDIFEASWGCVVGNSDTDNDGLLDGEEFQYGSSPTSEDTDSDTIPDQWEVLHGLHPAFDDAGLDLDGDGLTNLAEYNNGGASTDVEDADSDGDGIGDGQEVAYGLDPLNANTIQQAVDQAEDGDTIFIHPGTHTVVSLDFGGRNILLSSLNPNDSAIVASTILQGDGNAPVLYFHSGESNEATVLGLTVCSGLDGVAIDGSSPSLIGCVIRDNTGAGVTVTDGEPRLARNEITGNGGGGLVLASTTGKTTCPLVAHNLIAGNTSAGNGAGILINGTGIIASHNTIADNRSTGTGTQGGGCFIQAVPGNGERFDFRNSILFGNLADSVSDEAALQTGVTASIIFCNTHQTDGTWTGTEAFVDPLFVQTGWDDNGTPGDYSDDIFSGGDYHLQSTAGRWSGTVWTADAQDSSCIDTGDPETSFINEPLPNGGCVNPGVYGGTAEASRTALGTPAPVFVPSEALQFSPGTTGTFGICLSGDPGTTVTVTLTMDTLSAVSGLNFLENGSHVEIFSLEFSSADWQIPQDVSLSAESSGTGAAILTASLGSAETKLPIGIRQFSQNTAAPLSSISGLTAESLPGTGGVSLSWNAPETFTPTAYHIYRAMTRADAEQLRQAAKNGTSPPPELRLTTRIVSATHTGGGVACFFDLNAPPGGEYWYAAVPGLPDGSSGVPSLPVHVSTEPAPTGAANAAEAVERAVVHLLGTQNADGSWGISLSPRTTFTATAQAARGMAAALPYLDTALEATTRRAVQRSRSWLEAFPAVETRILGERCLLDTALGVDGWTDNKEALYGLNRIDSDNDPQTVDPLVWKATAWHQVDAVSVALAYFLVGENIPGTYSRLSLSDLSTRNLNFTEAGDENNNGTPNESLPVFGWQPGGAPSVLASSIVYAGIAAEWSDCQWITDPAQDNFTLSKYGTELLDTAARLVWLPVRESAVSAIPAHVQAGIDFLIEEQPPDGGWGDTPHLTGICLEAVVRAVLEEEGE